MKISEIATIGKIGTVGGTAGAALSGSTLAPAAAKPMSAGSTTAPVVAPTTTANVAPTVGSSAGSTQPPAKPISAQGVDTLARLLKSAGLDSAQLGQIMQKAK